MSTRSRIGIIRYRRIGRPPVVESIYCHFDGYPEGVGQMLLDHWTDPAKIDKLMELGDLSSLGSIIGRKHNFDKHLPDLWSDENRTQIDAITDQDEKMAFINKLQASSPSGKGWCCAYTRDRGEKDCGSRFHLLDDFPDYGQEAEYVFDPEIMDWRVRRECLNPVGWNTVTPWEGWITIPEAIELEVKAREEYEREHAPA